VSAEARAAEAPEEVVLAEKVGADRGVTEAGNAVEIAETEEVIAADVIGASKDLQRSISRS
jgi:hypothetical protein